VITSATIAFNVRPGPRPPDWRRKLTIDYIRESISGLNKDHLIDLLLLNPRILIDANDSPTGFQCQEIPLSPLSNLVFTRDQQMATANGVVIGRFSVPQRAPETDLMSLIWPQLGISTLGTIAPPGTLEGGDFIPVNSDLSLLGIGRRSNFAAARQLMDNHWVGTERFVIVQDLEDLSKQRAHLDTVFGMLDDGICACLEPIANDIKPFRRIAREFVQRSKTWEEVQPMPFGAWLKKEGWNVVPVSLKQQEGYFVNFLNLGRDARGKPRILAVQEDVEKVVKAHGFGGTVATLDFAEITAMCGGARCATQVLRRPGP
jgi:arginine deiminase